MHLLETNDCRHFEGSTFYEKSHAQFWLNVAFSNEGHSYYFIRYMHLLDLGNCCRHFEGIFFFYKKQGQIWLNF
jgi:hypothetical protein